MNTFKNIMEDDYPLMQVKKYCRMLPLEHSAILLAFISSKGSIL